MTKKWQILVRDRLDQGQLKLLWTVGNIIDATNWDKQQFHQALVVADALIVRSRTLVTDKVLSQAKKLKVIGRVGVGVDNIDVEAASKRRILVVNAPTGNAEAVAEHTIGLIIALLRHIPQAHQRLLLGVWDKKSFIGRQIAGKRLGVIGFGRIGSRVANKAKALEMKVFVYTRTLRKVDGITFVSKEELLTASDIVSLHLPLTNMTRHFIGRKEIELLASHGAYLVNCSRGELVDENALVEQLKLGRLAGAALDVFTNEPLGDHPLTKLPNVVLTPHIAGSTVESLAASTLEVAENIMAALTGKIPKSLVNPQVFKR